MAIEELVRCDMCGEYIAKQERTRAAAVAGMTAVALRRNQDRPESAEYLDVGPCCHDRPIGELIKLADSRRPEDASGYKA